SHHIPKMKSQPRGSMFLPVKRMGLSCRGQAAGSTARIESFFEPPGPLLHPLDVGPAESAFGGSVADPTASKYDSKRITQLEIAQDADPDARRCSVTSQAADRKVKTVTNAESSPPANGLSHYGGPVAGSSLLTEKLELGLQ